MRVNFDLLYAGNGVCAAVVTLRFAREDHGPVFFSQQRIGTHRRPFRILKFRTMRVDTPHDTPTHLLENPEQWITRVGRVLRKTSLDELPQILQILTGRMKNTVPTTSRPVSPAGLRSTGGTPWRSRRRPGWTGNTPGSSASGWM